MKFLLAGHGGSYNRGCEAIIRSTILMLSDEFGSVDTIVSSLDYDYEKNMHFGNNDNVIPAYSRDLWEPFTIDWFKRQLCRLFSVNNNLQIEFGPVIRCLKNIDVVLSVGGDNYTLDYNFPEYFVNLNKALKQKGKKLVIWGASVGPFEGSPRKQEIIDSITSVDLITARETCTIEYLKSIGVEKNVRRVADPAFLLPLNPIKMPEEWQASNGILGFNVSPILHKYTQNHGDDEILKEVVDFLRGVIKTKNMFVLLIPHVTKPDNFNNDYTFMQTIYSQLKETKGIGIVSPEYNAMQMKYIISQCRFFIGARTHATIAAFSTGVPTISIGYSLKSRGINQDLFGHTDYVLDIKDLSFRSLSDKFTLLLEQEGQIRQRLLEVIPETKNMARKNVEYLKEIL